MKKSRKRGFTIVELVIVIAVIAILAAILIPTFSNIIKKSNLSADKQAVREINSALAADQATNGVPDSVDKAMSIIASAGYDIASYQPLTEGYEIYWVDTVNRVILFDPSEGKIVYPEQYAGTFSNDGSWHIFNESYKLAVTMPISKKVSVQDFPQGSSTYTTTVSGSSQAGASLTLTYTKDSNNIISNPIYTIVAPTAYAAGTTQATIDEKQAGTFLYTLAVQLNEGLLTNADGSVATEVDIKLPTDMPTDISAYNWKPIKDFAGSITPDSENENAVAVVNGLSMDKNLSFVDSTTFDGNSANSKYNVCGFIANMSKGTVKNIEFKDVNITLPCEDYIRNLESSGNSDAASANVFGVVGCVIPDYSKNPTDLVAETVNIENVKIEGGAITGVGRVAGVIGYIGGSANTSYYVKNGTVVNVKDCVVKNLTMTSGAVSNSYGSCGGIISYISRCQDITINIDGCTVLGNTMNGLYSGGIVGLTSIDKYGTGVMNVTNCTIANNTFVNNGLKTMAEQGVGIIRGYDSDASNEKGIIINVDLNTLKSAAGNKFMDSKAHTKVSELVSSNNTALNSRAMDQFLISGLDETKLEGKTKLQVKIGNYYYVYDIVDGKLKTSSGSCFAIEAEYNKNTTGTKKTTIKPAKVSFFDTDQLSGATTYSTEYSFVTIQ